MKWIKSFRGDYYNAEKIEQVGIGRLTQPDEWSVHITCANDGHYTLEKYLTKGEAEAARDRLIRILGGEVYRL